MSSPTMTGKLPIWRFGKTASFGLWARPLGDSKILIMLYKGVVFSRTNTFVYKLSKPVEETEEETEEDGTGTDKVDVKLEFRQKISPKLIVTEPCCAVVPQSAFPIVVVCSEENVLYTDDELKTFKKMSPIPEDKFYATKSGDTASEFALPELDEAVFLTNDSAEETKKGLLIPVVRISAGLRSNGSVYIKEVLDIREHDLFAFENGDFGSEEKEPDEDCTEDGETGAGDLGAGDGGGDGGGGGEAGEAGDGDSGETGKEPCPEEETDYTFEPEYES